MPVFTIGKLSEKTRCNIETIRYYERIGLLRMPPRTSGKHRIYSDADVHQLAFIRRSRELGFSIDAIRTLLGLLDGGDYTCADIKRVADDHLADVRSKIAELRRLERGLKDMIAACDEGDMPDCPILEALYAGG